MSNKITNEQVAACFKYSGKVHSGIMSQADAKSTISSETGMRDASAQMYIQAFLKMMEGEYFSRTINAYATEYYFENILSDYGSYALLKAISSVKKHLEYYKGIGKSSLPTIHKIVERFIEKVGQISTFEEINNIFEEQVSKSILEPQNERQVRLGAASKSSTTVNVSVKVYIRNPDVVAEVLNRAKGVCERCGAPAPFRRAKDNTPYLEVHHVRLLSEGGDDSVENAKALCPNCHRELHFGV